MRLVLLGAPGAGKGTLASSLKNKFGLTHISTGDILREEIKNNTPLGQEAKKYIESGGLVPDDVVTKLIEHKFLNDKQTELGYMLDGFPRTKQQAEDLDKILVNIKLPIEQAIYMEATLPVIIVRLIGRRVCRDCGELFHIKNKPSIKEGVCDICEGELYQRSDDNEETIKTRLDVYVKNVTPIISFYEAQNKLIKLNADNDSAKLQENLIRILNEDKKLD